MTYLTLNLTSGDGRGKCPTWVLRAGRHFISGGYSLSGFPVSRVTR
jgi:hypothetical protein